MSPDRRPFQADVFSESTDLRTQIRTGVAPIDIEGVLTAARAGNEPALGTLYGYTNQVVQNSLRRRVSYDLGEVEIAEIAESTAEGLLPRILERYDTSVPTDHREQNVPEYQRKRFQSYVNKVVGSRVVDYMRKKGKEQIQYIDIPKYDNHDNTAEIFPLIQGLLTPGQAVVVEARGQGKSIQEAADELELSYLSVKSTSHRVKVKVEKKFFTPHGLVEVDQVKKPEGFSIKKIARGDVRAIKFLSNWYVKESWIDDYSKNYILPPVPGYLPITAFISTPEIESYIRNNISRPELAAINRNNRFYAHPDAIQTLLNERFGKQSGEVQVFPPPTQGEQ